ncbi:RNA polymerase sigma factor [Actinosynnema pretiosum subsp. pretiosum]|nr:sigma factor-like helix-turn-helix DNA-binding protein [Actinosynnema mirum]AXX30181.1 RNA polymerase sigma factor [Actinosynnema pretiosum subsp. pretiosum]
MVESVRPLVVRYCRARIGRRGSSFASADHVAGQVCLAVLAALPTHHDRPFLALLHGIASREVAPHVPSPQETPAPQGEPTERMAALLRVLPERHREIVVLRVAVGLSVEETATAVGSTPGAVRLAQHQALARLREDLGAAPLR